VFVQSDPHFETLLALSGSQAFISIAIFDLLHIYYLCEQPKVPYTIGIWCLILVLNFYFFSRRKSKKIIHEKPKLFESHRFSVIVTLAFFFFSVVCMFMGPILGKRLLESCL
jgi:ABC-type Fe3+ transport system permease subunit